MQLVSESYKTIEEYEQEVKRANYRNLEVLQTAKGCFDTKMRAAIIGSTSLIDRNVSIASIQTLQLSDSLCRIVIPYNCQAPLINGDEITDNKVVLIAPEEEIFAVLPDNFHTISFGVKTDQFAKYFQEGELERLYTNSSKLRSHNVLGNIQRAKEYLVQYTHALFSQISSIPREAITDIEESILLVLEYMLRPKVCYWKEPNLATRLAIVRRSREYLASSKRNSVSVLELSKQACCSVRSLEYAFKDILGITPKRYLNIRKTHQIRSHLVHTGGRSINSVLKKFGVINQGRFSSDYNRLFGEYPKDTLARIRRT